jgi:hypothetical protein
VGPIRYEIDVADPLQRAMQGFAFGDAVAQTAEERALKQQQIEAQKQAQAQQQQALQQYFSKATPSAQDYAQVLAAVPQLKDQLKQGWDALSADQRRSQLQFNGQIYAGFQAGRPDIVAAQLKARAEALRNSGNEAEANSVDAFAKLAEKDPRYAERLVGMQIAAVDPDKFGETFKSLGGERRADELQEPTVAKARSDATTAAVTAKYAESNALQELEKRGYEIEVLKLEPEFKRQTMQIQAMQAALAREANALKRTELQMKIEEAKSARETRLRERVAEADAATTNIDNMLNTVQRVLNAPGLNDVVGSIEGRIPALLSDEDADAIALIDTLGSQAFLSQIPNIKGMGQLSNAEGEKLQAALQNLTRVQSEAQFRANLNEASRLLTKARTNIERRLGVPASAPDVPAAPQQPTRIASDAEYNALPSGTTFTAPDGTVRRKP